MSKENVVSIQVPEKELEAAIKKIQEVRTILKPYLVALQAAERKNMLKMSDRTLPFVMKAVEYAQIRQSSHLPT